MVQTESFLLKIQKHDNMNTKIQELTDIIYKEGVVKGQAEAEKILVEAKAEAERIVAEAQKEADALLAAAGKKAADDADAARKELKLYAAQAVGALKSEIADVVTDKIVSEAIGAAVKDGEFMPAFMLKVAEQWSKDGDIAISAADAEGLRRYFMSKAKSLLDSGVQIKQTNGKSAEFSVQPADGSYKVNFGQEQFENWLKSMLRPQLVDVLF